MSLQALATPEEVLQSPEGGGEAWGSLQMSDFPAFAARQPSDGSFGWLLHGSCSSREPLEEEGWQLAGAGSRFPGGQSSRPVPSRSRAVSFRHTLLCRWGCPLHQRRPWLLTAPRGKLEVLLSLFYRQTLGTI